VVVRYQHNIFSFSAYSTKLYGNCVCLLYVFLHIIIDLDHPADVQIHSWGKSLKEAFEQAAVGMFGIMTEIETVDPIQEETVEATGHDMDSLLFNFLDECLFSFCVEPNICACKVEITDFDATSFSIKATLHGETFNLEKHPQGTEVKAITYSNLQIHSQPNDCEVYVIVDI